MTSGCISRLGSEYPLRPLAGGEGRVRGGHPAAQPVDHLTLPHLRRGPLPLPRNAAERGYGAAAFPRLLRGARYLLAVLASAALASGTAAAASGPAVEAEHGMVVSAHRLASEVGVH